MKKVFLVDSSVLIDFLRRKDKKEAVFYKYLNRGVILASSEITVAEIFAGKSMEKEELIGLVEKMFKNMRLVFGSWEIAVKTGELLRKDKDLGFQDAWIAATALVKDWPVLTLNKKDFGRIPGVKLA